MDKRIINIHRVLFWLNVILLTASLVFFLIKWNELPNEIGIHFDPNGNFDVNASKFYGFYPHLTGGIFIIGIAVADYIIKKKSSGLKISEKGERLFRAELLLTLDIFLFIPSAYFSYWAYSVTLQRPMNTDFAADIIIITLVLVLIGVIIQVITCRKHRLHTAHKEKSGLAHRMCRLIAWLLTIGGLLVMIVAWERLPGENGTGYFANPDAYLDKRLLLIPQLLIIALLVIFEIKSVKASNAGRLLLVSLTDKLKLICGVFFFWWNLMLCTAMKVGIISVCLFISLCTASVVWFWVKRKSTEILRTEIE